MSERKDKDALDFYSFNADVCKGDDMLEAGVMIKRFGDLARAQVVANIQAVSDPSQAQEWSLILKRLDVLLAPAAPAASPAGAAK